MRQKNQKSHCKKAENCGQVYEFQQCTAPHYSSDAVETHSLLLPPQNQPVSEVDEVKGGKMKKKCKKIKWVWKALFGNRRASEKYTQKTSLSEGEKKDQGADAAVLQSRRNTDSKLHDHFMRI